MGTDRELRDLIETGSVRRMSRIGENITQQKTYMSRIYGEHYN